MSKKQNKNGIQKKKNNSKNAQNNKKNLKKNLKRAIEEKQVSPKKMVVKPKKENKVEVQSPVKVKEQAAHRITIYYKSKEAADAHHTELRKNVAKYKIHDIVAKDTLVDPTILKVFVGFKPLNDDDKKELLKITKATSVKSASKSAKGLQRLLLLTYDNAETAKAAFERGPFQLRGHRTIPTYSEKSFRTEEPKKKQPKVVAVEEKMEVEDEEDSEVEDEEDSEVEEEESEAEVEDEESDEEEE